MGHSNTSISKHCQGCPVVIRKEWSHTSPTLLGMVTAAKFWQEPIEAYLRSCKRKPEPSPQEFSDDEGDGDDPQSAKEFEAFKLWLDKNGSDAKDNTSPSLPDQSEKSAQPVKRKQRVSAYIPSHNFCAFCPL